MLKGDNIMVNIIILCYFSFISLSIIITYKSIKDLEREKVKVKVRVQTKTKNELFK